MAAALRGRLNWHCRRRSAYVLAFGFLSWLPCWYHSGYRHLCFGIAVYRTPQMLPIFSRIGVWCLSLFILHPSPISASFSHQGLSHPLRHHNPTCQHWTSPTMKKIVVFLQHWANPFFRVLSHALLQGATSTSSFLLTPLMHSHS